ncbi:MAG: hypothetical protein LBE80_09415, partial [Deltaproteobacteria bacterium]|nr:hypothetical protein [Deltaproteobacteria bacterium]
LDNPGLYELLFLYLNYQDYSEALRDWEKKDHLIFKKPGDLHESYLTHPGDEMVSKALIYEITDKAKKLKAQSSIIKTLELERFPYQKPEKLALAKLYDATATTVLTQGQKIGQQGPVPQRGGGEKSLAYLSHEKGWFVLSRHPLYISQKDHLDLGLVSDLHLSSRQVSYKLVAPQVIHGADPIESPYLGELCHQSLDTTIRLINSLGAECQALIVAGDAFDVLRNLDPKVVESKTRELRRSAEPGPSIWPIEALENLQREIKPGSAPSSPFRETKAADSTETSQREIKLSTAELWEHLDFEKYKNQGQNYPFYIDALMFMGIILDHYSSKRKPVFYLTGNHEGYEVPYGISPRIVNNKNYVFRANPGIPSDQNLTFYEAALLFGKKYSYLGRVENFKKENLDWAYRWITPWKDCLVNIGKNQNLLLLGWGDDESYLWSATSGGGSLPRAGLAFTDHQLSLLKRMTKQSDKFNVMASHFTYANFDLEISLRQQNQKSSGSGAFSLEKTDTGSFEQNRQAVYSELKGGQVKLTLSGHSHRAGAYTLLNDDQIGGLNQKGPDGRQGLKFTEGARGLKSIEPQSQFNSKVACLVAGSGGLYSYQNLNNSKLSDMDKPQGLLIKFDQIGQLEKVQYYRDETSGKPRLAVRCDYLWYENQIQMFFKGQKSPDQGDFSVNQAKKTGQKYLIYLNPQWLFFLNDQNPGEGGPLPIDHFCLHCLNRINYQYFPDSLIKLELDSGPTYPVPGHGQVPAYQMTIGPDEVKKTLEKRKKLGGLDKESEFLYFLSVHFNPNHPIGRHYDLSSPWCYPVTFNSDKTSIKRKVGLDGELPRYDLLKKIPEYNPTAAQV